VASLSKGGTFTVWGGDRVNKIATPSLATEIGAQVERVATRNATGTFHLVGDDAIERFELAILVCEVFDLDTKHLLRSEPPESELFPAAVPIDTSLSNKASKEVLGLGPTGLRDLLKALRLELETGTLTALTKPE
jgi:dTDP-4-dehydrorhamnose reductase